MASHGEAKRMNDRPMHTQDKIRQMVFAVFDELNEQLPANRKLVKAGTTALAGPNGLLDSLGLVNFIVALEQKIEADFETSVSLIDDDLLSQENHFSSVDALTGYLASILPVRVDD